MSLASRLPAIPALIAFVALFPLVTLTRRTLARFRRRRRRRRYKLFLWFDELQWLMLAVLAVSLSVYVIAAVGLRRCLRLILARTPSSSATSASGKLAMRLILDHARFGVRVARNLLSAFVFSSRGPLFGRL